MVQEIPIQNPMLGPISNKHLNHVICSEEPIEIQWFHSFPWFAKPYSLIGNSSTMTSSITEGSRECIAAGKRLDLVIAFSTEAFGLTFNQNDLNNLSATGIWNQFYGAT